jgi:DNA-binding MarR family transcriptional regulator
MPTSARLLYLMRQVQTASYNRLTDRLKEFNLTAVEYMVMSILGHREELSSAQLSRRFSVTPQTMMRVVIGLEDKNMIARAESPENRRILRIRLTAEGRRVLSKCETAVDEVEASMFAGFSARELAAFRAALEKFDAQNRPAPVANPPAFEPAE